MNGSSSSSPFASSVRSGVAGIRQAIDLVRPPVPPRGGARPDREDVRRAVLRVLAEQPRNGYQIVRALEERDGSGSATAGSVYPTLQLLADEGLVTAAEEDGRKTWTLTAAGRTAADAAQARAASTQAPGARVPERRGALARSGGQLAQAAALVAQGGTPDQIAEAVGVLDDARRHLHAILARN